MDPPDNDQVIEEICLGIEHFVRGTIHFVTVLSLMSHLL